MDMDMEIYKNKVKPIYVFIFIILNTYYLYYNLYFFRYNIIHTSEYQTIHILKSNDKILCKTIYLFL